MASAAAWNARCASSGSAASGRRVKMRTLPSAQAETTSRCGVPASFQMAEGCTTACSGCSAPAKLPSPQTRRFPASSPLTTCSPTAAQASTKLSKPSADKGCFKVLSGVPSMVRHTTVESLAQLTKPAPPGAGHSPRTGPECWKTSPAGAKPPLASGAQTWTTQPVYGGVAPGSPLAPVAARARAPPGNAQTVTPFWNPSSVARHAPLATSQTRAVPSQEPETRRGAGPPVSQSRLMTPPPWPTSMRTVWPLPSKARTTPSWEPLTKPRGTSGSAPGASAATAVTGPSWSKDSQIWTPTSPVPSPSAPVLGISQSRAARSLPPVTT
mmetsp:Transcript_45543/g.142649  ORF Transcript_45543/g.142649 Transcript_45543/m.142649 type:complete len:326 (+) Transcript_45543:522-1499(+)